MGWGGGSQIRKWRGYLSYLLGVKLCWLVPLRVLKSKMTMVRIFTIGYWVEKNMTEYVLCCLKSIPLRGKNVFEPRLLNETLVSFGVFLEHFRRAPRGSRDPGTPAPPAKKCICKNVFEPRLLNETLVSFGVFFEHFRRAPPGSRDPGTPAPPAPRDPWGPRAKFSCFSCTLSPT